MTRFNHHTPNDLRGRAERLRRHFRDEGEDVSPDRRGHHERAGRALHDAMHGRGPWGGGFGPGGFGPAAFGPTGLFGPRGPFGARGHAGRRSIVRRGDVRLAILGVLADGPMHGYQVMQELRERSEGTWAPSAGSIYPTLQQLEDEGLVRGEERDGRRVFTLTEAGTAEAAKSSDDAAPWKTGRGSDEPDARALIGQLVQAAAQVYQVGSPRAVAEAQRILTSARRSLYQLLASDDASVPSSGSADSPTAQDDGSAAAGEPGA